MLRNSGTDWGIVIGGCLQPISELCPNQVPIPAFPGLSRNLIEHSGSVHY